ncbi:MAG TPA: SWIM zinc finger family protein [Longilinea sp.]|nr:SWIM zinc finger family protein [Longilinea sp.]
MDSGMIGKLEKAKRYAEDRGKRVHFQTFSVTMDGENNAHTVSYTDSILTCDCDFFQNRGRCGHTMALELILGDMIAAKGE